MVKCQSTVVHFPDSCFVIPSGSGWDRVALPSELPKIRHHTLTHDCFSLSLSLYITYIYIRDLLIHVHIHLFIDIYAFTILYVSHIMVGWFVVVRGCTLIQLIRFPCHFQVCPTHSRFCSSVIKTIILNLPILLSTIRIAARRR